MMSIAFLNLLFLIIYFTNPSISKATSIVDIPSCKSSSECGLGQTCLNPESSSFCDEEDYSSSCVCLPTQRLCRNSRYCHHQELCHKYENLKYGYCVPCSNATTSEISQFTEISPCTFDGSPTNERYGDFYKHRELYPCKRSIDCVNMLHLPFSLDFMRTERFDICTKVLPNGTMAVCNTELPPSETSSACFCQHNYKTCYGDNCNVDSCPMNTFYADIIGERNACLDCSIAWKLLNHRTLPKECNVSYSSTQRQKNKPADELDACLSNSDCQSPSICRVLTYDGKSSYSVGREGGMELGGFCVSDSFCSLSAPCPGGQECVKEPVSEFSFCAKVTHLKKRYPKLNGEHVQKAIPRYVFTALTIIEVVFILVKVGLITNEKITFRYAAGISFLLESIVGISITVFLATSIIQSQNRIGLLGDTATSAYVVGASLTIATELIVVIVEGRQVYGKIKRNSSDETVESTGTDKSKTINVERGNGRITRCFGYMVMKRRTIIKWILFTANFLNPSFSLGGFIINDYDDVPTLTIENHIRYIYSLANIILIAATSILFKRQTILRITNSMLLLLSTSILTVLFLTQAYFEEYFNPDSSQVSFQLEPETGIAFFFVIANVFLCSCMSIGLLGYAETSKITYDQVDFVEATCMGIVSPLIIMAATTKNAKDTQTFLLAALPQVMTLFVPIIADYGKALGAWMLQRAKQLWGKSETDK